MIKHIYIIYLILFITNKSLASDIVYQSLKDSTGDFSDTIKIYRINEIIVQDRYEFFENVSSNFIKRTTLKEQLNSTAIGNLLASKSGIFTKSYGSEGSLQTISIRGSGSEYTSVFINGINYNNSLNGVFDFSKFSAEDVTGIIIKKGNDFDPLNNNSFGGVIELIPFEKNDTTKSTIKLQIGSFGYHGIQLKQSGAIFNTYYKINFSHKSAKNNYEYTFNNETSVRKNSDINQNAISLAFINQTKIFNQPVKINSFLNFLDKKLGLPNFVSSNRHNDSGTRERERTFSYSVNSKVFLDNQIYINGILGFQQNHLTIDDPLLSINLRTKHFNLKDNSISTKIYINLSSGRFFFSWGINRVFENYNRIELKENQNPIFEKLFRETIALSSKVNFSENLFKDFSINSSFLASYNLVSNDFQSTLTTHQFPNIKMGLSFRVMKLNLTSYLNAGYGTRLPNFYEYSFSKLTSLSNKELEPEKILNYEIGTRFEQDKILIELNYFTFDVQNKIIWKPQRVAFFSPINAGRIKSSGIEFSIEQFRITKNFSVSANYTLTNALKKSRLSLTDNSFNKQTPYIPKHKASISVNYTLKDFEFDLNSNFYSRRFITEDNDPLFSLEPIVISNLSSTYNFIFNQYKFYIQISIKNLFNKSYQLIQSFPMPGREYRLTIQMEV